MESNVPIAIVGMSCRFAGDVSDPQKLWQLVAEGRSAWSEVPSSRFNLDGVYHPNSAKPSTTNVIGGHFLSEDIGLFDASFFNFSAELAASLDPQFRLQLESTFEAMESAGITLQDVAGSNTSVYAGAFFRDYHDTHLRDPETLPRFLLMGVGSAMASNRLSHFFDLRGPSMSVDTGCSTTLTALHQACQNLQARESDMSIVGGANLMFNPDNFIAMSSLTLLSPAGKSYAFDSRASGYGRGEGSATVILKRLDDAIRDGDPIRAVIRGSGLNQDGKTDTITTPSQEAQEELIRRVYHKAGLDPAQTAYFEAHGTGTPTGDPIEARAVASVFKDVRTKQHPLRIGSVKTNVGHTETTSGLASIIKVVLALEKRQIPPSINFETPNELIHLEEWNLKIPTQVEPWPELGGVRRASVNNFGYGGANAHVILEDYQSFLTSHTSNGISNGDINGVDDLPNGDSIANGYGNDMTSSLTNGDTNGLTNGNANGLANGVTHGHTNEHTNHVSSSETNGWSNGHVDSITNGSSNGRSHDASGHNPNSKSRAIILRARDAQATEKMAANLKDYLSTAEIEDEGVFLDSIAYTLGQRRSNFPWVAAQPTQTVSGLIKAIQFGRFQPKRSGEPPRLGFVFTGQGAQWHAMGRELIEAYPVYKACLLEAGEYLTDFGATWSPMEELMKDIETTRVNELAMSMPLCAVVQIALVRLLHSWGVVPAAVTSHSSGEIAAAYAAGALTLKAAMAIVFARGKLAANVGPGVTQKGGMIAVGLGVEDVEKYISRVSSGQVMVACLNSPTSITVSGDVPAIEELETMLKEDNVFARRLKVDAAYHSHHMQPIAAPYLSWLQKLVKAEGRLNDVIYSSPTTGHRMSSGKALSSPEHWVRSLTNPVQFVDAFRNMCLLDGSTIAEIDAVIEVGPHAALSGPIAEICELPELKSSNISYISCLVRKSSALDTMQTLACDLTCKGYPVNLDSVNFPDGKHGVRVLHDLPPYPWNHEKRHWTEPRLNKTHRHRLDPPHDLLGSLVLGTNMLAPSWRLEIRTSDIPWVRDHVVQGNIVYPGAGYICMAIEGACQAAQANPGRILGYQLRDIDILSALVVPDTAEGVEVQLTLRPCSEKAIYAKGWQEFQICSVTAENKWLEHCKGLISVDFAAEVSEQARWSASASPTSKLVGPKNASDYRLRLDPRDIYFGMRSVGICHGPIFQNLKSIRARTKQSVTSFAVADTASTMPYHHQHKHVLDPTTLDSIFQAAYTALPGAGSKMTIPLIPKSIQKLWVSHDIASGAGHRFRAYSDITRNTVQRFDTDIVVVDDDDDVTKSNPVIMLDGFIFQSIGSGLPEARDPYENEKFSLVKWAPDLSYINPAFFKQILSSAIEPMEAETLMDLRRLCVYYINDTLADMTADDVRQLEPHHEKFYAWMKLLLEQASHNELAPTSSGWVNDGVEEKVKLIEKATTASVNGEMVCRLGPQILSMMRRQVTPLELMLEDKLLFRYYTDGLKWDRASRKVGEMVKHFAHKNPRGKILEIGGGTGGTTRYALDALGTDNSRVGPLAASYDFTDISSGFFEAAQEKFKDWKDLMKYRKFDIEQDPIKQGFENGTYDLIIACQVLHATKSMDRTMANVRRLLKPGGKLVIMETTKDQEDMQLVFGLLPGWWLSEEEERKHSPSLSIDMWDRVLRNTGFNGVEIEVHDCESEELYSFSTIMSTAKSDAPTFNTDVAIVTGNPSPPTWWLEELKKLICQSIPGVVPVIQPLDSVVAEGKTCIFLGELSQTILKSPDATQFDSIKSLCTKCKGLLWVTRGGVVDYENLDVSLQVGFLRSLRVEYVGKRLASLDLDPKKGLWSQEAVAPIADVFLKIFDNSTDDAIKDFEFAHREGAIQVPRYFKDVDRNKAVFPDAADQVVAQLEPFNQAHRPLRMVIGTPGLLDTLAFHDDPDATDDLQSDYIEVDPKAFGLNFRDVMIAMGQLEGGYMGFECSGVITRTGAAAASQGFKAGDRVAMLLRGHYSNKVRQHWTSAVHMPDDMSFEVAATLPMSYSTAYFCLYEMARLQKGERVLIHAATGGFGQAAIVLAKHVGAEIFVTVGTEKKRDFVVKKYDIQPDHIFTSRDISFASGVLAMTQGKGVDVVLNTLAGALLQEGFNCVAQFGRFIEVGKRDLELNSSLEMGAFTRAVTFSSIDLLQLGEFKGHDVHRVLKDVIHLYNEKVIVPVEPVTVYPISEVEKSFRLMQAGKHMGKIVISANPNDLVPVLPPIPKAKLRADSSYLIIGGLGGIGRSVCHWMATRGAKNLIVTSRGANAEDKARPFMTEMEKVGCRVKAVGCDVSDAGDLAEALATCKEDMPPIRGVVQGAMVLEDSILEQMTFESYNAAIRPKVQGSWNLHQQLSKGYDLDFFMMLSSLAGVVGFVSQSNYSAGGAFQDALARYRTARGLPGVAIDIGIVKSVGYVAEDDGTAERLRKSGHTVLSEDDVLGAIESAIISPPKTQMMLGLNSGPGANWEESGMARDHRFSSLRYRQSAQSSVNSSKTGAGDLGAMIAAASSFDEATNVVVKGITKKLMDIFMIAEAEIAPSNALHEYGVDSLVAVELRNMLALRAGAEVSIFDIMQSSSITAVGSLVASKSSHIDPSLVAT